MKHLLLPPEFDAWRNAARVCLRAGFRPEELDLQDAASAVPQALALDPSDAPTGVPVPNPNVSRAFLEAATLAAAHRDTGRWNLLYRLLYRLQAERTLLQQEADPDVVALQHLTAQVNRDLQKMQAFVRFHKVLTPADPPPPAPEERPLVLDEPLLPTNADVPEPHHLVLVTPTLFGETRTELEACADPTPALPSCEHFVAWYQPEHRILPLAAPFFTERFAILHWTILTPDAAVSWDPDTRKLHFTPGVTRDLASAEPSPVELESLWRTHQQVAASTPPSAVPQPATPKPTLSPSRPIMPTRPPSTRAQQPTAQPFVPADHALTVLAAAMPACRGCELYCYATQVVPGAGNPNSSLILVGEQPGNDEDLQGLPFVGPAGKLLDRALNELHIDRSTLFVTNAVKHFKFIQRGKLRLHQNPRMSEINACRPWLHAEIDAIRPRVILCLGATASKSLLGPAFSLMRERGKLLDPPYTSLDPVQVIATIHPSAILRARDQQTGHQLYAFLKDDLTLAHQAATAGR